MIYPILVLNWASIDAVDLNKLNIEEYPIFANPDNKNLKSGEPKIPMIK